MKTDLAVDERNEDWAPALLEGLRPALLAHEDVLDNMLARFDADYRLLSGLAPLLFGQDCSSYGRDIAALFVEWDAHEESFPRLPAILALAFEHFNLPQDGPGARAVMAAAVLGEIPNHLLYHGNPHYRKVVLHVIRLLATQMGSDFPYQPILYNTDLMTLLIATPIHDLGHIGGDNMINDVYKPGYLEQRSFDLARPVLEAAGLEGDVVKDIETILFCTDITFTAGDNSPCVRMKKIYRHFFLGGLPEDADVESMMLGKLRRFEDNPRLSVVAMLLHEADIASSAGLTYEQSKLETVRIMREREMTTAGPKVLLKFLNEQLGGTMTTPAAQKVFGAQMAEIMLKASEEAASGVETF